MSLIHDLREDVIDSKTSLPAVLRRAKVLASLLKLEEFEKWIDNELDGYKNADELPDYRRGETISCGNFMSPYGHQLRNAQIPTRHLPEKIHKYATTLLITPGVRSLESLLEDSKDDQFRLVWPPDLASLLSNAVFEEMSCLSAYRVLPRSQVALVLDTVRNRLLGFILELEKKYPQKMASEKSISQIPKAQAAAIFNTHIHGGHQTFHQTAPGGIHMEIGDHFGDVSQSIIATRGSIAEGIVNVREGGQKELADAIKKLEQAIVRTPKRELSEESKREALQLLDQLIKHASSPTKARSVLRSLGIGLWELIKGVPSIAKILELVWPHIAKLWT